MGANECAQRKLGLRPGMVFIFFPPGAPLRRGGVYPLKAGGAERCAVLYGAERRGAPEGTRTSSLHPTYLLCVGCANKGVL